MHLANWPYYFKMGRRAGGCGWSSDVGDGGREGWHTSTTNSAHPCITIMKEE